MAETYKIQEGDTLSEIAQKKGTTVSKLQEANEIENPDVIQAGSTLDIPSAREKAQEEIEQAEQDNANVTEQGSTQPPPDSTPSGDTDMTQDEIIAEAESIQAEIQGMQETVQERMEEDTKDKDGDTKDGDTGRWQGMDQVKQFFGLGDTITREKAEEQAAEELGFDTEEEAEELKTYQNQMTQARKKLNTLEEQKQKELDRNSDRQVSQALIDREEQQINEKYRRKRSTWANQLNAAAANAEMVRGNMDRVRKLTNTLVNQSVAKEQRELNAMQSFIQMNPDWYKALPEDQRERWKKITGDKAEEVEQKKTRMTQLKDTYINNGLTIPSNFADMSIAEIEQDLSSKVSAMGTTEAPETIDVSGTDYMWDRDKEQWVQIGTGEEKGGDRSGLNKIWNSTVKDKGTLQDFLKRAKEKGKDKTNVKTWLDSISDQHSFNMGTIEDNLAKVYGETALTNMTKIARKLVKNYGNVEKAKNAINKSGAIKVKDGDDIRLSDSQKNALFSKMDSMYPSGKRRFWHKWLPGGA